MVGEGALISELIKPVFSSLMACSQTGVSCWLP